MGIVLASGVVGALLLLAIGCTADLTPQARGWSPVAVGQIMAEDGNPQTVLYVGTVRGDVMALDPEALRTATVGRGDFTLEQIVQSGLLWRFRPDMDPPASGVLGPAAIGESMVYVGVTDTTGDQGRLFALKKDRDSSPGPVPGWGEWQARLAGSIVGGPVLSPSGDKVLVGTTAGVFHAFEADSGTELWRFPSVGKIGEIWSTPAVFQDRVYFGSLDHKVYSLLLEDGTLAQGWPFETSGSIVAQPLLVDGKVIIGSFDRKLYSIDAATGQGGSILKADSWFWAAAVSDGLSIFATSLDGVVHMVDQTGNPIGTINTEQPVVATPRIMESEQGGLLLVAAESGEIYGIPTSVTSGTIGTQGPTANSAGRVVRGKVKASLTSDTGTLYLGTTDGTVWALGLQNRLLGELWRVNTKG